MTPVLPLRTVWIADILSQASMRDVERQRCWKRGSGDEKRLWNYCTARLSDLSMPSTGEVRHSPEPSARPSARGAANLCDVLIRGERWIVLVLSPIVRDVQRQRCWKRGSGDGQRLSLYDYGTTERSFNAVERWGSTLTWTVCTAADSEKRQICTSLFAEGVGLWKDDGLMLSPIVEHTSVWEGVGGREEIWRGSPQWNTKDQLPKPQTATVATAQWPNTYPNKPDERTASTEQISKKES